jgi:alcohol dehydrogenase YqhD (iron-dependent ADH family)
MIDFDFVSPTKIFFGKEKENNVGDIIASYGYKNILIVYGQHSVIKSGLLDKVCDSLKKSNVNYLLFGGVRANPTTELVHEGLTLIKEAQIDLILAVGGGSVIDVAKSIGCGYFYNGDPFDFNMYLAKPTKCLPIGVILTIAASGSELSNSCVIQDDARAMKKGFNNDIIRPLFAIEDPELTYTCPQYQTSCGIVDIMMHTLERYFSDSDEIEMADDFAVALLKNVVSAGKIVQNFPNNYEARSVLMLAGSLSHNGLTSIGKNNKFPCHYLEHILSGLYPEVAHGAGLAVIFPNWAESYLSEEADINKMSVLAKELFHCNCNSKIESAKMFIAKIREYFTLLGMPSNFEELGLNDVSVFKLGEQFAINGTRAIGHGKKPLDQTLAIEIFARCNN